MIEKANPLRSEKHRKLVASMPCYECEREGHSQAAHANFGKGIGIKACDSQIFPMCQLCHQWLDQSGELSKEQRRIYERAAADATRSMLKISGQWRAEVEEAFQRAEKYNYEVVACK